MKMNRFFVRVEIDHFEVEVDVPLGEGQDISDLISKAILSVTSIPVTVKFMDMNDHSMCTIVDTDIRVDEIDLVSGEDEVEEVHENECRCTDCASVFAVIERLEEE